MSKQKFPCKTSALARDRVVTAMQRAGWRGLTAANSRSRSGLYRAALVQRMWEVSRSAGAEVPVGRMESRATEPWSSIVTKRAHLVSSQLKSLTWHIQEHGGIYPTLD